VRKFNNIQSLQDKALFNSLQSYLPQALFLEVEERLKENTLIYQDDVSSLGNYRKLIKDIEIFIEQKNSFTLAFLDLDDFKSINETYGHVVGTKVLRVVGGILLKKLPEQFWPYCYRYGGDEFISLFPHQTIEESLSLVSSFLIFTPHKELELLKIDSLTCSIGVSHFPSQAKSLEEIIHLADQAMFCHKKTGKAQLKIVGHF